MTTLPGAISLREVGPRDGLQNEDPVPTEAKVRLLDALSATGVRRIEAVSFVHPRAIPQMADADEVWRLATRAPGVRYSALVPHSHGAGRALDAGFTEIDGVAFGDTTGMATPRRVRDLLGVVRERHGDTPMLLHFHDTRGTALANILT